jgi:hypothetical protein
MADYEVYRERWILLWGQNPLQTAGARCICGMNAKADRPVGKLPGDVK